MEFVVDGERTPGMSLVERFLSQGESNPVDLTAELADQAMEALEHLSLPYLVSEIIESGERFAAQVHSEATRGLQEIVQNADDQGARNIRFGYRRTGRRSELLVAHDGHPVEIQDVLRMAMPLLSGSRADPDKIGRFGVGLKTLNQLGDRLGIHCPPLPGLELQGGRIKRTRQARAVRDFWNPGERETLFVLSLQDERFDFDFFVDWLSAWDASSLLFLRHLQSVSLRDLRKGKVAVRRAITVGPSKPVDLGLPGVASAHQATVKDASGSRSWTRYSVRRQRPKQLAATHKQLGDAVLLQLAVPRRSEPGRVFVGLPLEEECDLPYSIDAPFEPNVERTRLRDHNKLNEWLIARLGDLATAVSLRRFAERPKTAWLSVPLREETAGETEWTTQRFTKAVAAQRKRVAGRVRLRLPDGAEVRLADFTYEEEPFDDLLTSADVERLWDEASPQLGDRRAVPSRWRDGGRWRAVLADLDETSPLLVSEALAAIAWPDDEIATRGSRWLVDMVAAGLAHGAEEQLWDLPCIALANDGGRRSPATLADGGVLLVHSLPREGLAATLGLAQQIARPFRARDARAQRVRGWLTAKAVLRERASDADALRGLSRAERDEPIDLSRRDAVVRRLRNSYEQLPADERAAIGPGIGRNIALSGYAFGDDGKRRRVVRLADAYLPSAIDKNEGWPLAAGKTPGLAWVDRRYSDVLKGPRGQGALATLRALGARVAPRLEPAPPPSSDPHAPPLVERRLPALHEEELADLPDATGLSDDWVSPDLEAVVGDLRRERPATRSKRARALFVTLDRAWSEEYAGRSKAQAVYHYYNWQELGPVSASWLARLASVPWLSTRDGGSKPAAPRDLTVLTPAAFEIQGDQPDRYVAEIDEHHADSPVVAALGIQGRPSASRIVDRLEDLRSAEAEGTAIDRRWAGDCYRALASYCPNGRYEDRSDQTASQLRRAFGGGRKASGLIRAADGAWHPPAAVRRDPWLDDCLPHVGTGADALWELLGVKHPTAADCADVCRRLAERDEQNRSSEVRVFRCLLQLATDRRLRRKDVADMPLRTYGGWQSRGRTIYAVASPSLAEALGARWPVWRAPLPIDELAPLLPVLGVELIDSSRFEADVPSRLASGAGGDLQADFAAAVGQLQDYLAVHHPALHERLSPKRWRELAEAHVIAGSGWSIKVRAKGRRSVKLSVRAHLFDDDSPLFCVQHDDEAGDADSGGAAVAGYFVGDDIAVEARSTLALAWAYAFAKRDATRDAIELGQEEEPQDAPDPAAFERLSGKGRRTRRKRQRRTAGSVQRTREPDRLLPSIEDIDLSQVTGVFLEPKRRGKLRVAPGTKTRDPKQGPNGAVPATPRAGVRQYSDRDREDLALEIVQALLAESRGVELEDIRSDRQAGADAVDRTRDVWVELKAHGRETPDSLRLEPVEALRAEEKGGSYWLAVVSDLEIPRTPQLLVIPDPMARLDTVLDRGLRLTGLQALRE